MSSTHSSLEKKNKFDSGGLYSEAEERICCEEAVLMLDTMVF